MSFVIEHLYSSGDRTMNLRVFSRELLPMGINVNLTTTLFAAGACFAQARATHGD